MYIVLDTHDLATITDFSLLQKTPQTYQPILPKSGIYVYTCIDQKSSKNLLNLILRDRAKW